MLRTSNKPNTHEQEACIRHHEAYGSHRTGSEYVRHAAYVRNETGGAASEIRPSRPSEREDSTRSLNRESEITIQSLNGEGEITTSLLVPNQATNPETTKPEATKLSHSISDP